MYNFAAPTSPNDEFARTQTCTLENTASVSSICLYRLRSEWFFLECLECFLWFCLFDRNKKWEMFPYSKVGGKKWTKVLNTSALVLNKKKNFALALLKQHISFLLKINVVVVLMASISATLFICYTVKTGKTDLAKNRIDFAWKLRVHIEGLVFLVSKWIKTELFI